jgi:hypothetical protein
MAEDGLRFRDADVHGSHAAPVFFPTCAAGEA